MPSGARWGWTSGPSRAHAAWNGGGSRRHADSRWARQERVGRALGQIPSESPTRGRCDSPRSERSHGFVRAAFVTDTIPCTPAVTIPSPRAPPTATPYPGDPLPAAPWAPTPAWALPLEIICFPRRCFFPLGCIYFFVDRRGSPSLPVSESVTSHSEPRHPLRHRAESKGTDPLGAQGDDLGARARILEDRGSSPRPALIPRGWLLSEQLR
jgi:hypothetical protein